jgi:7-cyano-7-deazaguanine reductase
MRSPCREGPALDGYRPSMAQTALTKLGNPDARPDRSLEVFETADPTLRVTLHCAEFTCRCPITNQPDWATIDISYTPRARVVESKSVKLYLETFREEAIFHEHLATLIRDDFVAALDPESLEVRVNFNSRGGIAISATSSYTSAASD